MATFRVEISYIRPVVFFVEAEDEADVIDFMEANPGWNPGDVEGLIDFVDDEYEYDFRVEPELDGLRPQFAIDEDLELVEVDPTPGLLR